MSFYEDLFVISKVVLVAGDDERTPERALRRIAAKKP